MSNKQSQLSRLFDGFLKTRILPDLRLEHIVASSHNTSLNQFQPVRYLNHPSYQKSCSNLQQNHIENLIKYNVGAGKNLRAHFLIQTYEELRLRNPDSTLNCDPDFVLACAWSIEFLQAAFLVADDIMDKSLTRRGKTCWYLKVGDTALNDALLLESLAYRILSFYNSNTRFPVLFNEKEGNSPHSNFFDLKRIIEDVTHNTKIGQSLDMATEQESGVLGYTEERYNSIVAFKTSFYTIYLPVVMGIMLAGGDNSNNANQTSESSKIEKIALEIGHFFQVQDDYLDCYGNEAITGKIGTDIQDSKCSWLFVKAMEFGSESQKSEIVRNYGKNDAEMVGVVKKVYGEIGLEGIYGEYQRVTCEKLEVMIGELGENCPKDTLRVIVDVLNKRTK